MTEHTIAVHEQMLRHFSGVLSALHKLLKEIADELKEIKESQQHIP